MNAALHLAQNAAGRDFVVGDIPGGLSALHRRMKAADFAPSADRLFCVGHLPSERGSLAEITEFLAEPFVFAVRGDREQRLLAMADGGHLDRDDDRTRGLLTANHTPWWIAASPSDRMDALRAIRAMPLAIQATSPTGSVTGFVHAQVPSGLSWQAFVRSLDDDDGYIVDAALHGRMPATAAPPAQAGAVPGVQRVFVGHADATAHLAAPNRPSNVVHVNDMICASPAHARAQSSVREFIERSLHSFHALLDEPRLRARPTMR